MFYERENKIFSGIKKNPATNEVLSPSQAFVLFYKIKFPKNLIKNYLEEFNKMQGFVKTLPEDQKVTLFVYLRYKILAVTKS